MAKPRAKPRRLIVEGEARVRQPFRAARRKDGEEVIEPEGGRATGAKR